MPANRSHSVGLNCYKVGKCKIIIQSTWAFKTKWFSSLMIKSFRAISLLMQTSGFKVCVFIENYTSVAWKKSIQCQSWNMLFNLKSKHMTLLHTSLKEGKSMYKGISMVLDKNENIHNDILMVNNVKSAEEPTKILSLDHQDLRIKDDSSNLWSISLHHCLSHLHLFYGWSEFLGEKHKIHWEACH